jgi:hypothetical protein
MPLGDEVDGIFRREVKSLPAYAKAQAAWFRARTARG